MLPRQQKPLPGEQKEETSVQENSYYTFVLYTSFRLGFRAPATG